MKSALHPERDDEITVSEYIKDFGPGPHKVEEQARCLFCKQPVLAKGFSTPATTEYFAHGPNSGFCPFKTDGEVLYKKSFPKDPDFEAARVMKKRFRSNWKKHFWQLNWIVKGLDFNEFEEIITLANRQRIWEYAKLQEWQLPYVFATLTEFSPANSYKWKGVHARQYWFRCWFDASIQCYDDLCNHQASPQFWRASYHPPKRNGKPTMKHFCKTYPLPLCGKFLTEELEENRPREFVQKEVETWLNQHFLVE